MSYGRWFEEFETGAVYKHWPGRTITEYDNTSFALLSMNLNPLFIDDHFARTQPMGQRPVIDSLIFSLLVGMSVADTSGRTIANLGFDFVRFEQPMFAGDSLYGESEVLETRPFSQQTRPRHRPRRNARSQSEGRTRDCIEAQIPRAAADGQLG